MLYGTSWIEPKRRSDTSTPSPLNVSLLNTWVKEIAFLEPRIS
nr:MAG TPA: hypothetical protein [Caudoviricetes sp.]